MSIKAILTNDWYGSQIATFDVTSVGIPGLLDAATAIQAAMPGYPMTLTVEAFGVIWQYGDGTARPLKNSDRPRANPMVYRRLADRISSLYGSCRGVYRTRAA